MRPASRLPRYTLDHGSFRIAPKERPDLSVSHQTLSSSTGVTITSKAHPLTLKNSGVPRIGTRAADDDASACVTPNGSGFLERRRSFNERRLLVWERVEALPQD